MGSIMFALLFSCFTQTFANDIPEALLNAKTAFVENTGANDKDFAKLCKALKEWGRFELVQRRGDADIAITLSAAVRDRNVQLPNTGGYGGGVQTQQVLVNRIRIADAHYDTCLWSDENRDSNDPKGLVANLKNKMKKRE
jgi:hypothetical protein